MSALTLVFHRLQAAVSGRDAPMSPSPAPASPAGQPCCGHPAELRGSDLPCTQSQPVAALRRTTRVLVPGESVDIGLHLGAVSAIIGMWGADEWPAASPDSKEPMTSEADPPCDAVHSLRLSDIYSILEEVGGASERQNVQRSIAASSRRPRSFGFCTFAAF